MSWYIVEVFLYFPQDSEVHITYEDQQQINTFARYNARLQDLKEEMEAKKVRKLDSWNENALGEVWTCQNLHFDKCVCSIGLKINKLCSKPRCICVSNLVKICQSVSELCMIFHLDRHTNTQTNRQMYILGKMQILASNPDKDTNSNSVLLQLTLYWNRNQVVDSHFCNWILDSL